MENEHKLKILDATQKYKHICINIGDFIDLALKDPVDWLESADQEMVLKGIYATAGTCTVHVGYIVANGFIRVSNCAEPSPKNPQDWSPEVAISNLHDIDKIMGLKAFW